MNEPEIIRKRFIAAAVCPQCDAVDRIVVESIAAPDAPAAQEWHRRRCVACGFADEYQPARDSAFQGVPRGRPERPRTAPVNPVKVRILDPKAGGL